MIYITGDTHGERDRFTKIESQLSLTADDYLIICGDFGYVYYDDEKEKQFLDELEKKPYTILWIDGNHENFDAIYRYPVEMWNGGKIHKIRKNIFHLMRGQIFEIENKTFFTMGGAYSIDKGSRREGVSWWSRELPTDEEYKEAVDNLKKAGRKVDYILTHQIPREMIIRFGKSPDAHDMELCGFLEYLLYEIEYKHWFCGHWHEDIDMVKKMTVLWFDIVRVDDYEE